MFRRQALVLAPLLAGIATSCTTTDQPNGLSPKVWSQLQADAAGTGFNAVHTKPLAPLAKKWSTIVGELAFSSPVIFPEGSILIGTASGDLVNVNPDGTEEARLHVDESIVSTPAVDSNDDVYVISQHRVGDTFGSTLHKLPANGNFETNDRFGLLANFQTTASPKLWDRFVFVPEGTNLFVFEKSNLSLFAAARTCESGVCGSALAQSAARSKPSDIINCIVKNRTSNLLDLQNCIPNFSPFLVDGPVLQPSVAIIDQSNLADSSAPTIISASFRCLNAHQFDPFADFDHRLTLLWSKPLVPQDCDFQSVRPVTPVLHNSGFIVLGKTDANGHGDIMAVNLADGSTMWDYAPSDLGTIEAPPVAGLRQIYVPTSDSLLVLDNDGSLESRTYYSTPLAGAALGLDLVSFVNDTGAGSMSVDPGNPALTGDSTIKNTTHFGGSVPAIGQDGTVYVAMPNGKLHAYGPQFTSSHIAQPELAFVSPVDGQPVFPNALPIQLSVTAEGGGPFTGHVEISSSSDGLLCATDVSSVTSLSCIASVALTSGNQTLNAVATDAGGGVRSTRITVQVVPPIQ